MRMLYWSLALAAISLFTIFGIWLYKNKQAVNSALPLQFRHYQSIDSSAIIRSGSTSMTLLLESMEDIQSFLTANNEVIIYTVADKTENSFYKIAKNGVVTDSLTIMCRPSDIAFVKGFIIDKEKHQYYKWSFDGNKQAINIVAQNERLDWDLQKQQQQLADIKESSAAVYIDYETESPEPQKPSSDDEIQAVPSPITYTILTYFQNNRCFRFTTTLDVSNDFPYSYTEKLLFNNLFKRINTEASGNKEIIKTSHIRYRYFQELKLEKVRFSGGGGNAPGFDEMLFHGNLFTDVIYKTDTLRLKEFMYLEKKWHHSSIEIDGKNIGTLTKNKAQPSILIDAYMYYTNPDLGYALFSNSERKLYIIK